MCTVINCENRNWLRNKYISQSKKGEIDLNI